MHSKPSKILLTIPELYLYSDAVLNRESRLIIVDSEGKKYNSDGTLGGEHLTLSEAKEASVLLYRNGHFRRLELSQVNAAEISPAAGNNPFTTKNPFGDGSISSARGGKWANTSERNRLARLTKFRNRLKPDFDLNLQDIPGDNQCQFRAITKQLQQKFPDHKDIKNVAEDDIILNLRKAIAQYLTASKETFRGFSPTSGPEDDFRDAYDQIDDYSVKLLMYVPGVMILA
jgi:hypothetical protein